MDYAIANRINKLFTYSIARFTSDLKLWLSHIEFLKRMVIPIYTLVHLFLFHYYCD